MRFHLGVSGSHTLYTQEAPSLPTLLGVALLTSSGSFSYNIGAYANESTMNLDGGTLYLWLYPPASEFIPLTARGPASRHCPSSGRESDRKCYKSPDVSDGLQYGCGMARLDCSAVPTFFLQIATK